MNTLTTSVPAEMRAVDRWVVWRSEQRNGKATKVPYRADGSGRASSTDPDSWSSFEAAVAAVEALSAHGLGFVLGDGWLGIDLDRVLDEAGGFRDDFAPLPDIQNWVWAFNTYTERSPGGRGLHIIGRGDLPEWVRHRVGDDESGRVEVYGSGRFFTFTGAAVETEGLVREFESDLLHRFFDEAGMRRPEPAANGNATRVVVPVDLDDRELLARAFAAKNGAAIEALYRGDTSAHGGDDSAADLALCAHLAFWTGRDGPRMDRLFRSSGLYRDKWDERRGASTYGAQTIETAAAGCADVYEQGRGARPTISAQPENGIGLEERDDEPTVVFETLRDFLQRDVPAAESLVGVSRGGTNLLPRFGWVMPWGKEGCGKTSIVLDLVFHGSEGRNWSNHEIARPLRFALVINEGVPGGLQDKLAEKVEVWDGDTDTALDGIALYASPWGQFTFKNARMAGHLRDYALDFGADYVVLDPLHTMGTTGAGTPQETEEFKKVLMAHGLWDDLGFLTAHHSNKTGMVSGDWGRHVDTLIRLEKDGRNAATKLTLEKARPADPTDLGTPTLLRWITETKGYERVEIAARENVSDAALLERIYDALRADPDKTPLMSELQAAVKGDTKRVSDLVKKEIEAGRILNLSAKKSSYLLKLAGEPETDDTENLF